MPGKSWISKAQTPRKTVRGKFIHCPQPGSTSASASATVMVAQSPRTPRSATAAKLRPTPQAAGIPADEHELLVQLRHSLATAPCTCTYLFMFMYIAASNQMPPRFIDARAELHDKDRSITSSVLPGPNGRISPDDLRCPPSTFFFRAKKQRRLLSFPCNRTFPCPLISPRRRPSSCHPSFPA
jgi:hypothetical protein